MHTVGSRQSLIEIKQSKNMLQISAFPVLARGGEDVTIVFISNTMVSHGGFTYIKR